MQEKIMKECAELNSLADEVANTAKKINNKDMMLSMHLPNSR